YTHTHTSQLSHTHTHTHTQTHTHTHTHTSYIQTHKHTPQCTSNFTAGTSSRCAPETCWCGWLWATDQRERDFHVSLCSLPLSHHTHTHTHTHENCIPISTHV